MKLDITEFKNGAKRSKNIGGVDYNFIIPRYDLIPKHALDRLALRYGLGAFKYGEDNYKLGLPDDNLFNHAMGHLLNWKDKKDRGVEYKHEDFLRENLGDTCPISESNDDDLAAAAWNIITIIYNECAGKIPIEE